MEKLEDYVAGLFGVQATDLFTPTRRREVVDARKVCMVIMRDFTPQHMKAIASHFNMDHSMVVYAIKEVKKLCETDKMFRAKVADVYNMCYSNNLVIPLALVMEEETLIEIQ